MGLNGLVVRIFFLFDSLAVGFRFLLFFIAFNLLLFFIGFVVTLQLMGFLAISGEVEDATGRQSVFSNFKINFWDTLRFGLEWHNGFLYGFDPYYSYALVDNAQLFGGSVREVDYAST